MPKKMGRPKLYDNEAGKKGAPSLTVRLSPDVHHHIVTREEGPRGYIERFVRDDIERAKRSESVSPSDPNGAPSLGGEA